MIYPPVKLKELIPKHDVAKVEADQFFCAKAYHHFSYRLACCNMGHYITTSNSATFIREIPQNYLTFVLFDPPNMGNLMTIARDCFFF